MDLSRERVEIDENNIMVESGGKGLSVPLMLFTGGVIGSILIPDAGRLIIEGGTFVVQASKDCLAHPACIEALNSKSQIFGIISNLAAVGAGWLGATLTSIRVFGKGGLLTGTYKQKTN